MSPVHATSLFLHLMKTSENHWFTDVLREYRKRPVVLTHLTFTCSKSTIEALEKGVKYIQS